MTVRILTGDCRDVLKTLPAESVDCVVTSPTRPVLRWHGGKWRLAPWIISFFPKHQVYVEPFGGAASVLLRKERSYAEVYNDLDHEIVNLFRVLREPEAAARLVTLLLLTPFARAEFESSMADLKCEPVESARRLIMRSFMGFGTCALRFELSGFRANTKRSGTTPCGDWSGYPETLKLVIERLRGVVIEDRDATRLMRDHDGPKTLFYCDPPYMHETRSRRAKQKGADVVVYRHEMDGGGHATLLSALQQLAGMVVLSGYPSSLYDDTLTGWRRVEIKAYADGARERTEMLWLNPACCAALERERAGHGMPLFSLLREAAAE